MRRNWLEWVALAVSIVGVVGIVGFLLLDGLTDDGRPPTAVVEVLTGDAYSTDHGWIVPAELTNDGDEAAELLVLRATATVDGTEEEAEIAIDYLPAGTAVAVSFGFSAEPSGEVSVQVVGFRLP